MSAPEIAKKPVKKSQKVKSQTNGKTKQVPIVPKTNGIVAESQTTKPKRLYKNKVLGGVLSKSPILFSRDSKYFFCASGPQIKVFRCEDGALVRLFSTIEDDGHTGTITSLCFNPFNHLQLYSASLDGTIRLWDFVDCVMLRKYLLNEPVLNMVVSSKYNNLGFIYTKRRKQETCSLKAIDFKSNRPKTIETLVDCTSLAFTAGEEHIVVAAKSKFYLVNVENLSVKSFDCQTPVSTLACHPHQEIIAVGDQLGKVTLYYYKEHKRVQTAFHWHSHAVAALAFTNDGNYLVSGGEESVLVMWQLETRTKDFKPRLGAPINSISMSPDHGCFAIGHSDNTVSLVAASNFSVKQIVTGLKCALNDSTVHPFTTGLVLEPRSRALALPGSPGYVQLFDACQDKHIGDFEAVPMNKVSRTENEQVRHPHVRKVSFSPDGNWAATVDTRVDPLFGDSTYLRFWSIQGDNQYEMNTKIESPHEEEITSLQGTVQAGKPLFITTSKDKTFKVWSLIEEKGQGEEPYFACISRGFFRDLVPVDASFSDDGTLVAVAFGSCVTLWNPLNSALVHVLTSPLNGEVRCVAFYKHMLIVGSTKTIQVWDILSCSRKLPVPWVAYFIVLWFGKSRCKMISVDKSTGRFALMAERTSKGLHSCFLFVFNVESHIPLARGELRNKALGCMLQPTRDGEISVFVFMSSNELVHYGEKQLEEKRRDMAMGEKEQEDIISKLYGKGFMKLEASLPENGLNSSQGKPHFLDVPTHMIPCPFKLAVPHFESWFLTRQQQEEEQEEKQVQEVQLENGQVDMQIDVVQDVPQSNGIIQEDQQHHFNADFLRDTLLQKLLIK